MRCPKTGRRQPISRPGTLPPPKSRSMSHRVSRVRSSASSLADGVRDGEESPGLRGYRAGSQRPVATRRLVTARMGRSVRHRRTSSCRLVAADLGGAARAPEGRGEFVDMGRRTAPPGSLRWSRSPSPAGNPLVPDGDQVWFRFRADPGRLPGPPPPRRPARAPRPWPRRVSGPGSPATRARPRNGRPGSSPVAATATSPRRSPSSTAALTPWIAGFLFMVDAPERDERLGSTVGAFELDDEAPTGALEVRPGTRRGRSP